MILKWIRKKKLCVCVNTCVHMCAEQERERANVAKCEWLVDPDGGCVGHSFSVALKLFQKLRESGSSVSLLLRQGSETW